MSNPKVAEIIKNGTLVETAVEPPSLLDYANSIVEIWKVGSQHYRLRYSAMYPEGRLSEYTSVNKVKPKRVTQWIREH